MTTAATLRQLSLMDPHVQSDPFAFYQLLHAQDGLYQMPETGFFVVSRFDEVRKMLINTEVFSSNLGAFNIQNPDDMAARAARIEEEGFGFIPTLQGLDPPFHARHRKLVDQIFSARNMKVLAPRIEELCHSLIDSFIDRGECEFVVDFALPLPGTILAEQLGLPKNDYRTFKTWVDATLEPMARPMTRDELMANAEVVIGMQRFLADALEDRRQNPREDFLSHLLMADAEHQEPLSMRELTSVLTQLMMAGFETTTSALANALLLLIENPDQMALLRADRGLIKTFVEETLRHVSPVQGLPRRATRDTEIAGTFVPEGSVLMARYGAANHDPDKFECPHRFDVTRKNASSHLAFGQGMHFCVGRLLARQELATAFEVLLDRLDDIAIARPLPVPRHETNLILRPLKELPIRF